MIRGAIFDVDGTLLDSMPIWTDAGAVYLRSLGIKPQEDLWQILKTMTLEEAARYLIRQYQIPLSPADVMEGINREIEDFYFYQAPLRPGVEELLNKLHAADVKMAIATATDRYLVEKALERLGILPFFGRIFTCAESGSKMQPGIYRQAGAFLGTLPAETWVFEDACHGAATAARAGFPVLGIRDPSEENQQGLKEVSAVYLESFRQADEFFKIVSL